MKDFAAPQHPGGLPGASADGGVGALLLGWLWILACPSFHMAARSLHALGSKAWAGRMYSYLPTKNYDELIDYN